MVLIPVLPPTELSTWASKEVGICTKRTPRRKHRCRKARKIADDTAPEGNDDIAALDFLIEQKIAGPFEFNPALGRLPQQEALAPQTSGPPQPVPLEDWQDADPRRFHRSQSPHVCGRPNGAINAPACPNRAGANLDIIGTSRQSPHERRHAVFVIFKSPELWGLFPERRCTFCVVSSMLAVGMTVHVQLRHWRKSGARTLNNSVNVPSGSAVCSNGRVFLWRTRSHNVCPGQRSAKRRCLYARSYPRVFAVRNAPPPVDRDSWRT